MARINLRPWREELRAKKQQQFVAMLAGALIAAVVLVFAWQSSVNNDIAYQQSRNKYLENATKDLDLKMKEIEDLRKKREELLARMKVIQDLQGKRPLVVRVFDEMVRTLPDGLFFTSLSKKGDLIAIKGLSESNSRISGLMRNYENSQWFSDPNLTNVVAAEQERAGFSAFDLTVKQKSPEAEAEKKP